MHFSKVLVCTDLSPSSIAAFELAAYEKKMEQTEIILLHVHRMFEPFYFEEFSYYDPKLVSDIGEAYCDRVLSTLQDLSKKYFHGQNVSCEALISLQGIAEEICRFAVREKCDLIVMGSRGHTTLGSIFIGSVVQRVLLLAKCPVLIVPPQQEKDAKQLS